MTKEKEVETIMETEVVEENPVGPAECSSEPVSEKEKELAEARDRLLRLHADFDNFRKRSQKEKEEWYQYASVGILEKLLPVVDNFERALSSLDTQSEEVQGLLSGVKMIYRQLNETLQKEGLEPILSVGEIFDPNLHEAMLQVPLEEGQQDSQVVEELRKGYRFKERILRPTLVKVAKN